MSSFLKYTSFLFCFSPFFIKAQDFVEMKGQFFVKNFTNKAGKSTRMNEYYFRSKGEYYFIKNCESKFKTTTTNHLQKAIILAIKKEGSIDLCDDHSMAQSRIGNYISIKKAITESNFGFTLCDISGNCLILKEDSLFYQPMTPELSSSGTYSGGSAKAIYVLRNDRIWLVRYFKKTLHQTMNDLYYSKKKGEYYIKYDGLRGDVKLISKDFKKWDRFKNKICSKLL